MHCLYCNHPYTYLLGNKQRKCSRCKRRFSPAKQERKALLWKLFVEGNTATQSAKDTGMHIVTVQKYYANFRRTIALESDAAYAKQSHLVADYDEYLYLPKSLDPQKDIAKVKHFLTLAYAGQVYTLMMPSIGRLGLNPHNSNEQKLLEKYLTYHTISKLAKERTTIRKFWEYFEQFILKYKGVSDEAFAFYLKEAEWRFNTFTKNIK